MINLRHIFPGQRKDESVFIFIRRHPVSYIIAGWIFILMILLGIIGYLIIYFSPSLVREIYNIAVIVINLYLLFAISFTFVAVLDYYFDIHIVTDRRVVDIDQNRLFNRQIDELSLEDIEDVSSTVGGILGTVFNFGNVEIQTAGTKPNFIFENIPSPREVTQLILDLADQAKRGVSISKRSSSLNIQGIIGNELIKTREELVSMGAVNNE